VILESTDIQQAAELNSTNVKASDVNFHSVADFDAHSIDGKQRRSKHPGFNPHYMITT
jgi:hypothetical protein